MLNAVANGDLARITDSCWSCRHFGLPELLAPTRHLGWKPELHQLWECVGTWLGVPNCLEVSFWLVVSRESKVCQMLQYAKVRVGIVALSDADVSRRLSGSPGSLK